MIRITSKFECGNGKAIEQVGPAHFRLQVDGDKQSGYCAYFCFDVINDGPAADVTIELWEDAKFGKPTGFRTLFPHDDLVQAGELSSLPAFAGHAAHQH